MPTMRPPTAILFALLALGACARHQAARTDPLPAEDAAASPVVYADEGLELRWWVIADRHAELARALAPFASIPVPVDPAILERWERSGLRIVAVPLERLTALRDQLPRIGATNSQWIGQSPSWLDALGGPAITRPTTVVLDSSTIQLQPGQLRLLVRAWLLPRMTEAGARAALHVELLPQHRALAARALDDNLFKTGNRYRTRSIDALHLVMNVGPDYALLVVPERPDVSWGDTPAAGEAVDPNNVGPSEPIYPTLGGAMLTSSPTDLGATVNKAVVVLIPRVPERFELTAR